jgi:hypothetical protein
VQNKIILILKEELIMQTAVNFVNKTDVATGKTDKPAEMKAYLICAVVDSDETDEVIQVWEECIGRGMAYNFLYDLLGRVHLTRTRVLVEGVVPEDYATGYDFMHYCQDNFYPDKKLNIDSYLKEYEVEEIEGEELSETVDDGTSIVTADSINVKINTAKNNDINMQILNSKDW